MGRRYAVSGNGISCRIRASQPLRQETAAVGQSCSSVTMCDRNVVTKNAGISEEVQRASVECAPQALDKYDIEKDIAAV